MTTVLHGSSCVQFHKAFIGLVLTKHTWFENFALLSSTVCFVISTTSIYFSLSRFRP